MGSEARVHTLMCLGDSITYGQGSTDGGGYRVPLFRRARADGLSIRFVGSSADGQSSVDGQPFPRSHEGYPGVTIGGGAMPGLTTLAAHAVRAHDPDVILLMIGTNDLNLGIEVQSAPRRLGALLDSIALLGRARLVLVAQLPPSRDAALNRRIEAFNAAVPALVEARRAAGLRIECVDMHGVFTAVARFEREYLVDDVHPSDAGYAAIADAWYAQLAPHLR